MSGTVDKKQNELIVTTYRYMWTVSETDGQKIQVKILSGVPAEHAEFQKAVISELGDKLCRFAREYVCEYDIFKMGILDVIVGADGDRSGDDNA